MRGDEPIAHQIGLMQRHRTAARADAQGAELHVRSLS
jgi:hypothetical protein